MHKKSGGKKFAQMLVGMGEKVQSHCKVVTKNEHKAGASCTGQNQVIQVQFSRAPYSISRSARRR